MIVDAMQGFSAAFRALPQELSVTSEQLVQYRHDVAAFYSGQFGKEFEARNGSGVSTATLLPSDTSSIVSQYLYIAANPHPNGSKDALEMADDGSSYSKLHREYHPLLSNYQKKFGFYDIFLVDAQSGQIVYSVFKEVDYATNLKSGPYSNTNFARAFKEALVAGQSEAVSLRNQAGDLDKLMQFFTVNDSASVRTVSKGPADGTSLGRSSLGSGTTSGENRRQRTASG